MSEKMHRAIDTAVMNNTSLRETARLLGMTGPERLDYIKDSEVERVAVDIASAPAVADLLAKPDMFNRLNSLSPAELSALVEDSKSSGMISTDPFESYVQRNLACTVDSSGRAIGTLGESAERTVKSMAEMPGMDFDHVADQLHDKFTPTEILTRANTVNDRVNRAMQMVTNNTELFATPFADMDSSQQNKVMKMISNANLAPNQVKDMYEAAKRLESSSEGAEKAQLKIDQLNAQIEDANRRGDVSLETSLTSKRDGLEERKANMGDRQLNTLREKLIAQEIKLLTRDVDEIPINHDQLSELDALSTEPLNPDGSWNNRNDQARQAAKNLFDFMSNPYGSNEEETQNTPESEERFSEKTRRAIKVMLGAGALALGVYIGNKTGVQIQSPKGITEQFQAGGQGFSLLGRVSARLENAFQSFTGIGGDFSWSEAFRALNPSGKGGGSYAREVWENSTPGARRAWGDGFTDMVHYAKEHPKTWKPDLDALGLAERIKDAKVASAERARKIASGEYGKGFKDLARLMRERPATWQADLDALFRKH